MANSSAVAAEGLVVRPSLASDGPFLQRLYQSARPDLQWIDDSVEVVEQVVAQQFQVQEQGLGENFPNAMHYVVEKLGTAIGALSTDFGPNEIRVLYLAFIPAARGQGYG
ncbi:GNAT family N-acetyltransferase, partial [Pseudomonas monachiensis]